MAIPKVEVTTLLHPTKTYWFFIPSGVMSPTERLMTVSSPQMKVPGCISEEMRPCFRMVPLLPVPATRTFSPQLPPTPAACADAPRRASTLACHPVHWSGAQENGLEVKRKAGIPLTDTFRDWLHSHPLLV